MSKRYFLILCLLCAHPCFGQAGLVFTEYIHLHKMEFERHGLMEAISPEPDLEAARLATETFTHAHPDRIDGYLPKALLIHHLDGEKAAFNFLENSGHWPEDALLFGKYIVSATYEHESNTAYYKDQLETRFPGSPYRFRMIMEEPWESFFYMMPNAMGPSLDSLLAVTEDPELLSYILLFKAELAGEDGDMEAGDSLLMKVWSEMPSQIDPVNMAEWLFGREEFHVEFDTVEIRRQIFERLDPDDLYHVLLGADLIASVKSDEERIIMTERFFEKAGNAGQLSQGVRFLYSPLFMTAETRDWTAAEWEKLGYTDAEIRLFTHSGPHLPAIIDCAMEEAWSFGTSTPDGCEDLVPVLNAMAEDELAVLEDYMIAMLEVSLLPLTGREFIPRAERELMEFTDDLDSFRTALLENPIREFVWMFIGDIPWETMADLLDEAATVYPGGKYVKNYREVILYNEIAEREEVPASLFERYLLAYLDAIVLSNERYTSTRELSDMLDTCDCRSVVETRFRELEQQFPHNRELQEIREDLF